MGFVKSKISTLLTLLLFSVIALTAYQNCSKQRFSTSKSGGGGGGPEVLCTFSNTGIRTNPATDYRINQPITFSIDPAQYNGIAWEFYTITIVNGVETETLIPGTPTVENPQVTFANQGRYRAKARLAKNTPANCSRTEVFDFEVTNGGGTTCNPPTGINGPSQLTVGQSGDFSIARQSCFTGTVDWNMNVPDNNGQPVNPIPPGNGNEFTNVNVTQTMGYSYSASGFYWVIARVTSTAGQIFELRRRVEVTSVSCTHAGQTILSGVVFTRFAAQNGTCTVPCDGRNFRCENGNIVPDGHSASIALYPFVNCAPATGCVGGACGSAQNIHFLSRPSDTALCSSGTPSGFTPTTPPTGTPIQSVTANWQCSGTPNANCQGTLCHQTQILLNNQCYTCVGAAPNPARNGCVCAVGAYDFTDNRCECPNGQPPVNNSCSAPPPTQCNVFVRQSNGALQSVGTLPVGQSQTRYAVNPVCNQPCLSQNLTCGSNGADVVFNVGYNTTDINQCSVTPCPPQNCQVRVGGILQNTVANGTSVTRWAQNAQCGQACTSQTLTCQNGQPLDFSSQFTFTNSVSCPVNPCPQAPCNVIVGSAQVATVNNGVTVTRYAPSATCGQACTSQSFTCSNGQNIVFPSNFTFETGCPTTPCQTCTNPFTGQSVALNSSVTFAKPDSQCGNRPCLTANRTCQIVNGVAVFTGDTTFNQNPATCALSSECVNPFANVNAGCLIDTPQWNLTEVNNCYRTSCGVDGLSYSVGDSPTPNPWGQVPAHFNFANPSEWQVTMTGDCNGNSSLCMVNNIEIPFSGRRATTTITVRHIPTNQTRTYTVNSHVEWESDASCNGQ